MKHFIYALALLAVTQIFSQSIEKQLDATVFRNIGPFRGGRANGVSGVKGDPLTYYMATTGGGIWKTTDAGHRWENISDGYFSVGATSAIITSESNPNIIYAGTGEHAPRGVMTSYGNGVYKSNDAGKTWNHLGLDATENISRIVIHPTNPDIVYVAAQGALYRPNDERGIYKSTDGGKSWRLVLHVDQNTGASDLSLDMNNPMILYASMWDYQRSPWEIRSGGPGSGLYKSTDGGETWQRLENGLPKALGKMSIAVSRADSNWVYSLIESDSNKELGGLFLSKNAGESWTRVNDDHRLIQRAWYYIEVFPDPKNRETVTVLSAPHLYSTDAGKSFKVIDGYHGDYHDMWINPENPKNRAIADDGGVSITFDNGENWTHQDNMPTAQLYRVSADNLWPYNLYAGQQDNTSLRISTIALGMGGISERHWQYAAGGESAFVAFDPNNPQKTMGGSYLGSIDITDMTSLASTNIINEPRQYLGLAARDMKYLFNWNAPIIRSIHEKNTYYHGSQYVLKTTDEGQNWTVISPDLTRDQDAKQGKGGLPYTNEAVGAENYGTLTYITESNNPGTLYTASDDGLIHRTTNGGATWSNITPKKLQESLINAIEVSPHDENTLFIATTRYKFGDYKPGLYKTENGGKSWEAINEGIPYGAYTRVIRQDSEVPNLLFAGTELGLYISTDSGAHWEKYMRNLPVVPITDILVKGNDLVIATQGRSFWILDDLNVIRSYASSGVKTLYPPKTSMLGHWYSTMNSSDPSGTDDFEGVNPASGATIYYHLPTLTEDEKVTLTIYDSEGQVIRSFSSTEDLNYVSYDGYPSAEPTLSKKEGLNRFVWDLRHPNLEGVPEVYIEASFRGHKVSPGQYQIELKFKDQVVRQPIEVVASPLSKTTKEEWMIYDTFMKSAEANYNEMTRQTNRLHSLSKQLEKLIRSGLTDSLIGQAKALQNELKQWDAKMVQRLSKAYDDVENYENGFTANYIRAFNEADSSEPQVTEGTKRVIEEYNKQWSLLKVEGNRLEYEAIPSLNKLLFEAGVGALNNK